MRGKGTGELEQRVQGNWEKGERSKGHGKRQKEMLQATEHGQEQRIQGKGKMTYWEKYKG